MDAFDVLHTRRSIRQYNAEPVDEATVRELLEAAMSAPTAGGIQPWRFVVITDRGLLDTIADIHPYAGIIKQAPLAILVCGDTSSAHYGPYWVQDCSAAMQNLLLAARAKELASLWCGIHTSHDREKAFCELFGLPENVSPLGLAIIGHSDAPFVRKERYDETKVHHNVW
uniref:nitroreductase family protein n=1 Tax=uncultured Bilophila sp. TaxID=529385 RepID=UPI0025E24031|nr:nitroreductase family protein [uncultured Bilophila sp.]